MGAEQNKRTMEAVFAALAEGNGQLFVEAMHDDFIWTIKGHGPWGGSWQGKSVVRKELFKPLYSNFAGAYRNRASLIVAEGSVVVVECKGDVATKAGDLYDNDYCYVCRFDDTGKLMQLTEYMDTALAERVLAAPVPRLRT